MREIERGIHTLHSGSSSNENDAVMQEPTPVGDTIAIVNKVTAGSPASLAVVYPVVQLKLIRVSRFN